MGAPHGERPVKRRFFRPPGTNLMGTNPMGTSPMGEVPPRSPHGGFPGNIPHGDVPMVNPGRRPLPGVPFVGVPMGRVTRVSHGARRPAGMGALTSKISMTSKPHFSLQE